MRNTVIAFLLLSSVAATSAITGAEAAKAKDSTTTTTTSTTIEEVTSTEGVSGDKTGETKKVAGTPKLKKAKKAKGDDKPSEKLEKNLEKHMPDPSKPAVAAELKCSACAAVVHELYERFTDINKVALGKGYTGGKDYEFVDSMDYLCKTISKDWGLLVDGDTVTTDFRHRNEAKYQIRTGWVSHYIQDRCAEITDNFDQQLIKLGKSKREEKDWWELTCVVLDKSCASIVEKGGDTIQEADL